MNDKLEALGESMRAKLASLPEAMRQDEGIRQSLVCLLAQAVEQMGLIAVPAWKPPRSTRDRVDLVGVDDSGELPRVEMAFVVDPLVELAKVRALEWVEAPHKVVVTFSSRADKVQQSTFFLTPELKHLNLYK